MASDTLQYWTRHRLLTCAAFVFALKAFFAVKLDLYSDEIFYWFESTRPALAYSDLPFISALLAGIGPELFGPSPFAVRLPFLIIGSSIPFFVYWLARPLIGEDQARESALLALCLPLASSMGLLAVPDAPMIVFGLCALGMFLRARQTNSLRSWLTTGLFVALGLSTHYRFALFPLAVLLLMIFDRELRVIWLNPRAWLAGIIAVFGLVPAILFNLENDMASVEFYFIDRHAWEFNSSGLLQPLIQALVSTPPLYALLLITAFSQLRSAEFSARLISLVALLHIGLYAAAAPWSDPTSTTLHWPLAGYIPLLVFAPGTLRLLMSRWPKLRLAPQMVIYTGLVGAAAALIGVGSQSLHAQLQPFLGVNTLSTKMAAWSEFGQASQSQMVAEFSEPPLVITDNYYTALQLNFSGLVDQDALFTLDNDKAHRDGRAQQLILWRMGREAVLAKPNMHALFITEDSTLNYDQKQAVLRQACAISSDFEFLGSENLLKGAKRYSFYRLTVSPTSQGVERCPMPALTWIDAPQDEESVMGTLDIRGWAFAEQSGVQSITVLIDGKQMEGTLSRNSRPDVSAIAGATLDPDFPMLGFSLRVDISGIEGGLHHLQLRSRNGAGEENDSLSLRIRTD